VLSPDAGRLNWYGFAAVASALGMSLTMLLTRYMRGESRDAIVGWQAIGLALAFAGPAAALWTPMQPAHWLGCGAIGVLLWLSQHLNVFAYRYGEANAIQPAEASRLLVAIGIDVAIFGVIPKLSTFLGAGVIVLAIGTAVGLLDRLLRGRRGDAEAGD
jgi:drug/metabolite transporter (DMT)-like permease